MNELIEQLKNGCVYHQKRWSGDTADDLGGIVDESATDTIMKNAANVLEQMQYVNEQWLKKAKELANEYAHAYSFVGDDAMPKAQAALFAHIELATDAIELAQPQWQPIETAPKEERLLVITQNSVCIAKFSMLWKEWINDNNRMLISTPIYYMPLPKPPEA